MTAKPAALYARVSTDEQAEHGTSLDVQLAECESHARALGATATTPYVDAGVSGTLLARPALERLRQDVQAGRVALVVCYDPDRLSRNLGHLLLLVDELRRGGAEVEFTNFTLTATADGRLLFAMRGAIAEFETHKIRQRMTAGKIARAREGRPVGGGHTIYGYVYDRSAHRFLADPAEAVVVAHIFRLAEEYGTHAVAARLNAARVPAKRGGRWSQTSVYGILRNPTYLGHMAQMGGLGRVELPRLVEPETFARVAARLASRRNRPTGPARRPYLLSGRLSCGLCGRRMGGGYGQRTPTGYRGRYACAGKRGEPRCPSAYYPAEPVDRLVWRLVQDFLAEAQGRAAEIASSVDVAAHCPPALAAATAPSRQPLRQQRERLLAAYRNGILDAATLAEQLRALAAAERVALPEPLPDAQEETATSVAVAVLDGAQRVETLEDRRFVLEAMGLAVTLGPGALLRVALTPGRG